MPATGWLRDLGDAPDATNHAGALMTAYPTGPPGIVANFPTVYDPTLGAPSGPMHRAPYADAFLGLRVSTEHDADLLYDWDGVTNIDPALDVADQDRFDDGVDLSTVSLTHCIRTSFVVIVNVRAWSLAPRYLNVWIDWNQDGDWADLLGCMALTDAPEWAVQNQPVLLSPGIWTVPVTSFYPWISGLNPDRWMRVTLSDQPVPPGAAGAGPVAGYAYGETEDYVIQP